MFDFDVLIKVVWFLLLTAVLAFFARLREVTDFDDWFRRSVFARIKNLFWFKWFRSYSKDKHKRLYPFKWITVFENLGWAFTDKEWFWDLKKYSIPNHPAFYDGYHNFKNIFVVILLSALGWRLPYSFTIVSFFVWYLVQVYTYKVFVNENQKPITRDV